MKRILIVALASMMVMGLALSAGATEFQASGQMDFIFWGTDNNDFQDIEERDEEDFDTFQRLRLQLEFIASENLRGVWALEVGWANWGEDGFAYTENSVDIETRRLFMDFNIPQTDLLIRIGDFGWTLPNNMGSPVLDDNAAGILAVYPLMEEVTIMGFWMRLSSLSGGEITVDGGDDTDAFGGIIALNFDGIGSLTPYFVIANVGSAWILEDTGFGPEASDWENNGEHNGMNQNTYLDEGGLVADAIANGTVAVTPAVYTGLRDTDATAWWIGVVGTFDYFDPFVFEAEWHYGSLDTEVEAADRHGWLLALKASYGLDFMTPSIAFWYGSGLDDNNGDGDERLPHLSQAFGVTMFGFDGSWMATGGDGIAAAAANGGGTWGMAFTLEDISFVEDLTHQLQFAFMGGTNDPDAVNGSAIMGMNDWMFEITFANQYMIYENLAAIAEFGWASMYFDEDDHAGNTDELTDAWKFGFGLQYTF